MRSERSERVALAVLVALSFAAFYVAIARGVFVFGDDVLMFQVTEAMYDRGEVSVTAPESRTSPVRPVVGRGGKRFAKYGIGLSVAALPFYAVGERLEQSGFRLPETPDAEGNLRTGTRVYSVHLTNALAGGATVAVVLLLAGSLGYSRGVALITASALGGASVFAHSATTFLSEPLSALALTVALWAAVEAGAGGGWRGGGRLASGWLALSGLAAGFATAARVSNLAALVPLAVAGCIATLGGAGSARERLRVAACWGAPFAAWIGVVALYNSTRFGSVLETGYGAEAGEFSNPLGVGLAGLLVSPGRGLLWFAPPVALALVGWAAFLRRRGPAAWTSTAMALGLVLVAAKFYQWHGGGSWGPRLLVPVLPLLVLPAAEVVERAARGSRPARWLTGLVLGAGVLVVALSILVPFDRSIERVLRAPADLGSPAFRESLWRPGSSPLVDQARALPAALPRTLGMLTGRAPLPGPHEKGDPGVPDLAFARYGSHALLQVTRLAALVALAIASAVAWIGAREARRAPSGP